MKLSAIKRNSLVQMTVIGTSYFLSFMLSALVGRLLGPGDLGAWSATAAVSSIILGFTLLGIESPVARRMAVEPALAAEWLGHGMGMRLGISMPLSCLLIVMAVLLAYRDSVPVEFAAIYAIYASLGSISGLLSRGCQILHHFSWQYIPLGLGSFPALVAAYFWIMHGGGLLTVVTCTAAGQLLGIIGLGIFMRRVANPCPRYDWQAWKSILAESWPLAVSTPFLAAYSRVDSVLLLNLKGAESAGYYSAAYGFFIAFSGLASGVQAAMFPALAKSYVESPHIAYRLFKRGLRWMFGFAICGIIGTILLGRFALIMVYGEAFSVAEETLTVLMLASIFMVLNNTYGMTLNAMGQQKTAMVITIGGLVTNVIANLLLIPSYGFLGAAFATIVTEVVVLITLHLWMIPQWDKSLSNLPT